MRFFPRLFGQGKKQAGNDKSAQPPGRSSSQPATEVQKARIGLPPDDKPQVRREASLLPEAPTSHIPSSPRRLSTGVFQATSPAIPFQLRARQTALITGVWLTRSLAVGKRLLVAGNRRLRKTRSIWRLPSTTGTTAGTEGERYEQVLQSQMANLKGAQEKRPEYWQLLAWLYYERREAQALKELQNVDGRFDDPEFLKWFQ
jgi:hypothetical protein